ncbi:MAG: glycosyltransferase family 4 protein [Methanomassiliicoccales archaeon]|jgi:glycosyltransferase involved in cell wall biosynthesis|nr:glycosyltransferase family 4 protein [Methanomassiliicoccales archaeon]
MIYPEPNFKTLEIVSGMQNLNAIRLEFENLSDKINKMDSSPSKLRITMIGTLPPLKGISRYCYFLCSALSNLVDIEFVSFRKLYPNFLYPGGVDTEKKSEELIMKFRRRNDLHGYNPLTWLKTGIYCSGDVVHAQWWSPLLFPAYFTILILARVRCKRVVITVHNVIPHENTKIGKVLTSMLLKFADFIIVHSDSNKEILFKEYRNLDRDHVFVVPHGLLSFPNAPYDKRKAKDILGIPISAKAILFFGNIRPYKGLKNLIKAMEKVTKTLPNTMLIIAGHCWEDWHEYERLIKELNIEDKIIVRKGYVEPMDVPLLFAATDLVVLPYETFDAQSGVGLAALNYCKPMIVTAVGGLPELVLDSISVVEPKNHELLASRIIMILRDPRLLSKLEEDSKKIREEYGWQRIAEITYRIYEELLRPTEK